MINRKGIWLIQSSPCLFFLRSFILEISNCALKFMDFHYFFIECFFKILKNLDSFLS